jgi:hypothetical protein
MQVTSGHFLHQAPKRGGYGTSDGKTYANAWNGIESVDWNAVAASNPVTFWVCGAQVRPTTGVLTIFVEWEYLAQSSDDQFARVIAAIASIGARRHAVDLRPEAENVP